MPVGQEAIARAMRTWTTLGLLAVLAGPSHAATVTVLLPDGRPASDVAVMCRGHESDAALTGPEGQAIVPDDCRLVTCVTGSYVAGHTTIESGSAVCRLLAGVRVTLRLDAAGCGAYCFGVIQSVAIGGDRFSREFEDDTESAQPEARLDVVRLGSYDIFVSGEPAWWECHRSVVLDRAGEETISATWRSPAELRGIVIDSDGLPVGDVPVRARAPEDPTNHRPDRWRCSRNDEAPDLFTAADGSFTVPVDATGDVALEAGSSWDPDGSASIALTPPIPPMVTLRLRKASR